MVKERKCLSDDLSKAIRKIMGLERDSANDDLQLNKLQLRLLIINWYVREKTAKGNCGTESS